MESEASDYEFSYDSETEFTGFKDEIKASPLPPAAPATAAPPPAPTALLPLAPAAPSPWNCSACTLLNAAANTECAACDAPCTVRVNTCSLTSLSPTPPSLGAQRRPLLQILQEKRMAHVTEVVRGSRDSESANASTSSSGGSLASLRVTTSEAAFSRTSPLSSLSSGGLGSLHLVTNSLSAHPGRGNVISPSRSSDTDGTSESGPSRRDPRSSWVSRTLALYGRTLQSPVQTAALCCLCGRVLSTVKLLRLHIVVQHGPGEPNINIRLPTVTSWPLESRPLQTTVLNSANLHAPSIERSMSDSCRRGLDVDHDEQLQLSYARVLSAWMTCWENDESFISSSSSSNSSGGGILDPQSLLARPRGIDISKIGCAIVEPVSATPASEYDEDDEYIWGGSIRRPTSKSYPGSRSLRDAGNASRRRSSTTIIPQQQQRRRQGKGSRNSSKYGLHRQGRGRYSSDDDEDEASDYSGADESDGRSEDLCSESVGGDSEEEDDNDDSEDEDGNDDDDSDDDSDDSSTRSEHDSSRSRQRGEKRRSAAHRRGAAIVESSGGSSVRQNTKKGSIVAAAAAGDASLFESFPPQPRVPRVLHESELRTIRAARLEALVNQTNSILGQLRGAMEAATSVSASSSSAATLSSPVPEASADGKSSGLTSSCSTPQVSSLLSLSPQRSLSSSASSMFSSDLAAAAAAASPSPTRAPLVRQPQLVSGTSLRPHQLEALQWLASLHAARLNGILADEMGLGEW